SPSSTTTYTATATSVEGCTATATATVNVNALPAPSIAASSNPTTCGGNEGSISLGGLTAGVTYEVNYDKNGTAQATQMLTADGSGQITLSGLNSGSYTNILVSNTTTSCTSSSPLGTTLGDPDLPTASVESV